MRGLATAAIFTVIVLLLLADTVGWIEIIEPEWVKVGVCLVFIVWGIIRLWKELR